jgi:hypothetical protein
MDWNRFHPLWLGTTLHRTALCYELTHTAPTHFPVEPNSNHPNDIQTKTRPLDPHELTRLSLSEHCLLNKPPDSQILPDFMDTDNTLDVLSPFVCL